MQHGTVTAAFSASFRACCDIQVLHANRRKHVRAAVSQSVYAASYLVCELGRDAAVERSRWVCNKCCQCFRNTMTCPVQFSKNKFVFHYSLFCADRRAEWRRKVRAH
ncbi:hypothetical protein TRVL_08819 [Trypanosoma vivax]|nr:hypothetical protein TRVL_08819 [Trypanosoma vivax]